MSGLLVYMTKYAGEQYPREIRIESAFFVVQVFTYSKTAIKLFVSAGGIPVFAKFLDLNFEDNKDINFMAIDCINSLLQFNLILTADLLTSLVRLGLPERLAVAVDTLLHDTDDPISYKFLQKALDVLCAFAGGPPDIQEALCSGELLPLLVEVSGLLDTPCVLKLCMLLRGLANNPLLLNRLENVGLIPLCAKLLNAASESEEESGQVARHTKR
jgi:hypothetical protein